MPPRTNSPPPSSYETYDDATTSLSHNSRPLTNSNSLPSQKNYFSYSSPSPSSSSTSSAKNVDIARIKNRDSISIGDDDSSNSIINDNNDRENLNTPFILPFNITGRVFSSTALQIFSLIMTYSFCITTIWMIFCTSYLLTIYDDTRRMLRTSRVWARVKDGVRERIAMMGDDWEDFLQKHFDQHDGVDRNNNGHLGGGLNSSNNDSGYNNNHSDKNTNWLNAMFEFMTTVSGQNIADKFKQ